MIFKMTRIHRVEEIIVGRGLDAKVLFIADPKYSRT
jgi:hypothetical protein